MLYRVQRRESQLPSTHSLFIGVKIVSPEKAYNSSQTVGLLLLEKSTLCPGMSRSPRPVPEMPNSSPLTLASTARRHNSDQHVQTPLPPARLFFLHQVGLMLLESSSASFFSFSRQRLLNGQTNSYSVSHGVTPEVCVSVWFFSLSICITLQFVPRPAAFPAPAVPDGRTDLLLVHFGGVHDDDDRHAGTLLRASRAGLDPAATPRAALPGCQQRRGGGPQ